MKGTNMYYVRLFLKVLFCILIIVAIYFCIWPYGRGVTYTSVTFTSAAHDVIPQQTTLPADRIMTTQTPPSTDAVVEAPPNGPTLKSDVVVLHPTKYLHYEVVPAEDIVVFRTRFGEEQQGQIFRAQPVNGMRQELGPADSLRFMSLSEKPVKVHVFEYTPY